MNARRWQRRYAFKGPLKEYVVHLEQRLHKLEADLEQLSSPSAAVSSSQSTVQGSQRPPAASENTSLIFDVQTQESRRFLDEQRPTKRRRGNAPVFSPALSPAQSLCSDQSSIPTLFPEPEVDSQTQQPQGTKKDGQNKRKGIRKHAASDFLAHASGGKLEWVKMRNDTMFSTPDVVIGVYQLFMLRPISCMPGDLMIQRLYECSQYKGL
ncbi:hypothetical protein TruAng_012291 [Truncatella angustata]|nr:hypothetical protein TruAng_012291 [Truncatella angustata]